jgi:parallel beta-helix repeat protein
MDSHFNDVRKYGVLIDADSAYISIENNNFENPTRFGGYTTPQIGGHVYCLNGNNITVNNNILNNSGGQGVIFCYNSTTGKGTTKSSMFGNTCKGNGQEGATVYGGSNKVTSGNSVKNNTCIDNRFDQIEIWQSDKNTVENNTVAEPNHDNGNLGAICLYDTTGTTCTGNKVLSAQSNGIDITAGSSNCIVSENFIKDTDRSKDVSTPEKGNGILLDSNAIADPQYITITNNKISSSSGTIAKSGVYSTSNTDHHNKISGNVITGYEYGVHPYALETCGN